jgi:hypothetical protein
MFSGLTRTQMTWCGLCALGAIAAAMAVVTALGA